MAKRKGKPVSFDAMVKFFMQQYDIPTKRDVDRILKRLDQIETLLKSPPPPRSRKKPPSGRQGQTATDQVLEVITKSPGGAGFPEIQAATGLAEKKVRNIIFRLHKLGKIQRVSRGVYTSA